MFPLIYEFEFKMKVVYFEIESRTFQIFDGLLEFSFKKRTTEKTFYCDSLLLNEKAFIDSPFDRLFTKFEGLYQFD